MSVNRRVYRVKRYSRSRRGSFPGRFIMFAGIAAAVVVVVVLFVTGVFNGQQAKDASAQVQASFEPTVMPSATPIATPSPSASASPSPSPSASPEASSPAARELSLTDPHMQGDDVKALQEKLGITADGSFGPSTKTALKEWQEENGITGRRYRGTGDVRKIRFKLIFV